MSDVFSIEHCRLLVQTLGHSLWQASLIAIACWLVLRTLPARRASLRYGVACAGLLAVVASALGTVTLLNEPSPAQPDQLTEHTQIRTFDNLQTIEWLNQTVAASDSGDQRNHQNATLPATEARRSEPSSQPGSVASKWSDIAWPTVLAGLWASGVLLMFGRVARQLLAVRRLRVPSGAFDSGLHADLQNAVDELAARLRLRFPVRLVVSDRISVPGMIGTFWPVLLLPPAMLSGVPIEQLRIVIAHELAHARRFDFLVNLGQLIVESLLFFNPAVWWLSRQIRIEREACCDAAAVSATGSPVPVARTLLAIVERLRESLDAPTADRFAAVAGVQSFAGHNPEGESSPLFDRVRRIVTPELRPHVRVPWYTLLGVIAAYGLVSFGLYEGTAVTVHAVRRAMTPQERIAKIEELVAAKGELAKSVETESGLTRSGVPSTAKTVISGIVRTHDGSLIPKGLGLVGLYSTNHFELKSGRSGTAFNTVFSESASEHSFEVPFEYIADARRGKTTCLLYFHWASDETPQFAPLAAGPFDLTTDGPPGKLDLILKPGFTSQIQVVAENGNPVPNAFVASHFRPGTRAVGAILRQTHQRIDGNGLLTIPQSSEDVSWHAEIRAAGYQKRRLELTLHPDAPVRVTLQPARLVTLSVLSPNDAQPVPEANAFVIRETIPPAVYTHRDPQNYPPAVYETQYAPLLAYGPSNNAGMLKLDALEDGAKYDILILAPGYPPTELKDVTSETPDRQVVLSRSLSVSGRVVGDLTKLSADEQTGRRYLVYFGRHVMGRIPVEERGGEGHFRVDGLPEGSLTLAANRRRTNLKLTESLDDVLIDLDKTPAVLPRPAERRPKNELPFPRGASRKVILTLTGAEPEVPITGKLRVGYLTREEPDVYSSADLDIANGRVEFDVEVPTKIHWVSRSYLGYSIVGRSEIVVEPGDSPFHVAAPLIPGGAVRGEVRLHDGSLACDFHVDLSSVNRDADYKGTSEDIRGDDTAGEFVLTGVPFGQEFRLLVTDNREKSVAAVVSEPFSLSSDQPIASLKFQFERGRKHVIRLVDENGQPARGAKAGGWFNPGLGFSRSIGWQVNSRAQIELWHVAPSLPGEVTFHTEAAGPFRGQKQKFDWANLPETVTLKRGVAASGQIVDEATGQGIAYASFFLFPTPAKAAEFQDAVWGKTDKYGRFSFECLEPVTYQLNLYGAVPPRVPFRKNALGVLEPDYSNINDGTFPEWFVKGGSPDQVILTVKRTLGSRLKLAEPAAGR